MGNNADGPLFVSWLTQIPPTDFPRVDIRAMHIQIVFIENGSSRDDRYGHGAQRRHREGHHAGLSSQ